MRPWILPLALCTACSGSGGNGANEPPATAPPAVVERVVTALSPFPPGCSQGAGVAHVHSEVEPHLAVNPRDEQHLLAAWQQDRWSSGAARGLLSAISLDGGRTWSPSQAAFSECTGGGASNGGDFERASDPWVAFTTDGVALQSALAVSGGTFAPGSVNAMLAARSADGGRTWAAPAVLVRDGGDFFNDKETLTADPHDPRFAYVVWDRLRRGGNGPTYFARTADGGLTWEPARAIYDPGPQSQTIGNLVRVLPDGTLVTLFTQIDFGPGGTASASVRVIRSADRGLAWSPATMVSTHQAVGTRDPATGQAVRDGSILAQMAVGPDGALHVVWQDARFTGARDGIAYARSNDGGRTWSAPVRVNGDPSVPAFTPQVHVHADGTVGVSYFDLRSDTAAPETLMADYWLARSGDGTSWADTRIAAPFDLLLAPVTPGGRFLGDYMGLASAGADFLALYARTTGSEANRTDVFFARIPGAMPPAAAALPKAARLAEGGDALRHRASANYLRALADRRVRVEAPRP